MVKPDHPTGQKRVNRVAAFKTGLVGLRSRLGGLVLFKIIFRASTSMPAVESDDFR